MKTRKTIASSTARMARFFLGACGLTVLSACVTPGSGLYRPATPASMEVPGIQGNLAWKPMSIDPVLAHRQSLASFYDHSTLPYHRKNDGYNYFSPGTGRGDWIPYGQPGTFYRQGSVFAIPFFSRLSYGAELINFPYGMSLPVPERTYLAAEVAKIRISDGSFDPGRVYRTVDKPWVPGDVTTPDARWYVHPGIETIGVAPALASNLEAQLAKEGFVPAQALTLYQDEFSWEGVDLEAATWIGWRRDGHRLEILMYRLADREQLVGLLETTTDYLGFNLNTGINTLGWGADGRHNDGRSFDGIIDAQGRQGFGTTVFPDGTSLTGFYENDHVEGMATMIAQGRLRSLGPWKNGLQHGVHLVMDAKGEPVQREYWSMGVLHGQSLYRPGPLGKEWWWFGEEEPTIALGRNLTDRVLRFRTLSQGYEYTTEEADGTITNLLITGTERRGIRRFPDGQVYEGTFRGDIPEGKGTIFIPGGERFEGAFINGRLDGEAVRTSPEGVRFLVRFDQGERIWGPGETPASSSSTKVLTADQAKVQVDSFYQALTENTNLLIKEIQSINQAVAEKRAADRAAMAYAMVDSFSRELERAGATNERAAALNQELRKSGLLESAKSGLLEQARGSSLLAEYQFQRALEKAVATQDFRELKDMVVANLNQDDRYRDFARFLDVAGDLAQTGWDTSKALREANAKARAASATAMQPQAPRAINPKASWKGRGGPPPYNEEDVHLRTMALNADENFRLYLAELRAGNDTKASEYLKVHEISVDRFYELLSLVDEEGF